MQELLAKEEELQAQNEQLRAQEEELQAQHEELRTQRDALIEANDKLVKASAAVGLERDRLLSLINSISDEVWFADTEKRFALVNPAALREFNGSFVGASINEFVAGIEVLRLDGSPRPIEESPPLRALQGEVIRGEAHILRTRSDGELRYREVNASPVMDAKGNIIGSVTVAHDITESKAMEDELRRHRDKLQILVEEQVRKIQEIGIELTAIFESISDPFYVLDNDWRLTYINKEAEQTGLNLNKNHIGQNIWEVFPDLVGGELYQQYHEACATSTPIHTTFESTVSKKQFEFHLYPYENGLFVFSRDVTVQKAIEAEMARLDRLNIIGEMAASIGHEVRNPMTTVRGYLQRFAMKASFAEYHEVFNLMIEELDRGERHYHRVFVAGQE